VTPLSLRRRHRSNAEHRSGSESESRERSECALWVRNTSVEGRRTRTSESAKTRDSIQGKRDGDSNEIDESDPHCPKQNGPRISTLNGITIDRGLEDEKAKDSIRVNLESPLNKIESNCFRSLRVQCCRLHIVCFLSIFYLL
jgi:hypothetical protein